MNGDLQTAAVSAHASSRWYFPLRAGAAVIDYTVCWTLYFGYLRYFGSDTADGYEVTGFGHLLVLLVVWVALFPVPEWLWGRTLGKWCCDLRVVDVNMRRVTLAKAVLRRLLDPVDLQLFGIVAYVVARTNPLHQRVGDLVARTRVVEGAELEDGTK
jgi:uncharacterized RDD family membrane protein YckC